MQHYPDGGSITGLLDLVRGLDPSTDRAVVSFRTPNAFLDEFRAAGAEVVVLDPPDVLAPPVGLPVGPLEWRDVLRSIRREARRVLKRDVPRALRIRRLIRDHDVAIVHTNNDVRANRDAILAAWLTRRPLVVHVRWIPSADDPVSVRVDRLLARRADRMLYMSRAIEAGTEVLRPRRGIGSVLDDPFPVDDYRVAPSAERRDELGVPAGAPVVLHVGRIVPWKGQDVLLDAVGLLADRHPDVVAVLVGEATEQGGADFEVQLRRRAEAPDLAGRVVFAGARRDVPALLAEATVAVHTSTSPEPFGRVVVEAMAAGRPLVASRAGGVPEIVEDGVTGILVEPGQPSALAAALDALLRDPAEAEAMGGRARTEARRRFSVDEHVAAVGAVYDDLAPITRPASGSPAGGAAAPR